jgi:HrpA-like RNA helicase
MYSSKFFKEQMTKTTVPEILRVNLTNLILTLKCIGVDDVLNFDYMERPADKLILKAVKELYMLGALEENSSLSEFGRELCKYPLEPHFSKSLIVSKYLDCEQEMLTIVATLSAESVWMRVPRTN